MHNQNRGPGEGKVGAMKTYFKNTKNGTVAKKNKANNHLTRN